MKLAHLEITPNDVHVELEGTAWGTYAWIRVDVGGRRLARGYHWRGVGLWGRASGPRHWPVGRLGAGPLCAWMP